MPGKSQGCPSGCREHCVAPRCCFRSSKPASDLSTCSALWHSAGAGTRRLAQETAGALTDLADTCHPEEEAPLWRDRQLGWTKNSKSAPSERPGLLSLELQQLWSF